MKGVMLGAVSRRLVTLVGATFCLLGAVVVIALSAPVTAEARSGWCSSMSSLHNANGERSGWAKGWCRAGNGRIRLLVDCARGFDRKSHWLESGGLAWLYAGKCARGSVRNISFEWRPR